LIMEIHSFVLSNGPLWEAEMRLLCPERVPSQRRHR
jgi:hypothetical protein